MKEHFQPLAGNEVLEEFRLKLTPMQCVAASPALFGGFTAGGDWLSVVTDGVVLKT